jgi:deazaflavin-dependent oxidoreductase (nitroreductase family)
VATLSDWNDKIINEFRTNQGRVGGGFEGAPLLLLHSTGAKTGAERISPMMYQQLPTGMAVFASKAGADTNPAWYHNLLANPRATVEVGTETYTVDARVADDTEREPIWSEQKLRYPGFAGYEKKTTRQIPVVILTKVA